MTRVPVLDELPELPRPVRWKLGESPWRMEAPSAGSTPRVIVDNDFSGDPDDLFQLVHHVLSPSVDIRGIIASHLSPGDPLDSGPDTAANAALVARGVFRRMGIDSEELIVVGASHALVNPKAPRQSEAVEFILKECQRDDDRELFYAAGGGLTDLASALLIDPSIAEQMTLIWIGGEEHPDIAYPPKDAMPIEYNLLIDVAAAQVVFSSGIEIWQVPRDVYRQCLVSDTEMRRRLKSLGGIGAYLYDETKFVMDMHSQSAPVANTYALGDSPLVLLTALRSPFEPDATSSRYVLRPTPEITSTGSYRAIAGRRNMRIYTHVDVRLMFEDMFGVIAEFSEWQQAQLAAAHVNSRTLPTQPVAGSTGR